MKKTGLQYRFSLSVRNVWLYWHECLVCGFNRPDALHHIISPSSKFHKDGKHNESVFNSCPVHNYTHPNSKDPSIAKKYWGFGITKPCHVGNETWLYADTNLKHLLNRVAEILLDEMKYIPNENDLAFFKVYGHLYSKRVIHLLTNLTENEALNTLEDRVKTQPIIK